MLALLATFTCLAYLAVVLYLQHAVSEETLPGFLAVYVPQPPLLAPLAGLAALCLVLGRRRLLGLSLVVLVAAVLLMVPPVVPGRRPPDDPRRRIRIVTWNTHEEYGSAERMRKVIAKLDPDIVCLQEARRGQFYSLLPGARVAHTHEVTTLTRGRIIAAEGLPLGDYPNFRWGMDTLISLPQGQVRVFNVHYVIDVLGRVRRARRGGDSPLPDRTQLARSYQHRAVLDWLRTTDGPRLVAGDFNTPPRARIYRQLASVATDSFGAAGCGWGFTYHRRHPMIRIDYIWCTEGATPIRSFAVDGGASDHRLVVTDVLLPAGGAPRAAGTAGERPARKAARPASPALPEDTR